MKTVLVIGAGFAGMAAAAFMARAGWKVTIVEKMDTAGGRARQFSASGFTFDMGPSWYWMPDVFERFFHHFGKKPSDYYKLLRLDPSYRVYWENEHWDIPADYPLLRDLFEKQEQGAATSLDKYMKDAALKYKVGMQELVYKPGQSLTEFMNGQVVKHAFKMHLFTSIQGHIARYFKNVRLRQLLEFPVLFLGALPSNTPALYSLMNYADTMGGTWYPLGGMFSIVRAMQQLNEELGVEFRFNEEAEELRIRSGAVTELITDKGVYKADAVISGADYHFTEMNLLPPAYRTYTDAYWDRRVLAPSCLLYYIGLNKKLRNVPHHSLFFDVPFKRHAAQIYSNPQWPDEPLFYLSVSSRTDPSMAPADMHGLVILIPVASGLKNDTEALRQTYLGKVINRLEKHTGESISDAIVFKRTYGVQDFTDDYHSFKGNAYGLANTLAQTAVLKPSCCSKKVSNLFYTGQLTVPGPGVPPSLISGEVVATQVVKKFKS